AGIRVVIAVQDLHQGAFARAVLAQNRVDLACEDVEIDVVVSQNSRKLLRDPAQAQVRDTVPRGRCSSGHLRLLANRDLTRHSAPPGPLPRTACPYLCCYL